MVWGMGDRREMENVAPPWRSSRPSERRGSGPRGRVSAAVRTRSVRRGRVFRGRGRLGWRVGRALTGGVGGPGSGRAGGSEAPGGTGRCLGGGPRWKSGRPARELLQPCGRELRGEVFEATQKQTGAPWWLSKVGEGERRAHPGPRRVKSGGCVRPRDRHHLVVAESWCVGTGWAGVRGPSSQSRLTSLAFHFFVVQFSFP